MSANENKPQTLLTDLISIDEADNETIEFEPPQLNLMNRAVEL